MRAAPHNTAAILLAAGESRRFGENKLAARIGDRTVLERSLARLAGAGCYCGAVIIAPERRADAEAAHSSGFDAITNARPAAGISGSIALGLDFALSRGARAMLIALADMPSIPQAHFSALFNAYETSKAGLAYSTAKTVRMPPALFAASHFPALRALEGDAGARALLQSAPAQAGVALANEAALDVDTQADLETAREQAGENGGR